MTILGLPQRVGTGLTHTKDIQLHAWEVQIKRYADANAIDHTDRDTLGVIKQGSLTVPKNPGNIRIATGIPETDKKIVVGELPQNVEFECLEVLPYIYRWALGCPDDPEYTFGATTTINDAAATVNSAILTNIASFRVGSMVLIPVNGVNYERRLTGVNNTTNNVTWSPDLPAAPANGTTFKRIIKARIVQATGIIPFLSLWIFATDAGGGQVLHFLKKVRFLAAGNNPLVIGDDKTPKGIKFSGKSFGYDKSIGGNLQRIVCETLMLKGAAKFS